MHQNCLWRISNLEGLPELNTLNISNNLIRKLEGLACCPVLETLIVSNNKLESIESVAHLAECCRIHTLDLQNNNISDPAVADIFKQMPELRCLYLKGNPVVTHMKNYRKTMIAAMPKLSYLDDRPVFEAERRTVEAWCVGGLLRPAAKYVQATARDANASANGARVHCIRHVPHACSCAQTPRRMKYCCGHGP